VLVGGAICIGIDDIDFDVYGSYKYVECSHWTRNQPRELPERR
jgi:hypothetical protein